MPTLAGPLPLAPAPANTLTARTACYDGVNASKRAEYPSESVIGTKDSAQDAVLRCDETLAADLQHLLWKVCRIAVILIKRGKWSTVEMFANSLVFCTKPPPCIGEW